MENNGMINCPNCNKRTFGDKKECIYCKYILKNEHSFDNQVYEFLYKKYSENKNKLDTIKVGMEKFGLTMKEIKEIVDHISEYTFQNELAMEKKVKIEKQDEPREELPTNGIDYSKYVNFSVYTGRKKYFIGKFLLLMLFYVIVTLMCIKGIGSLQLRIVIIILSVILFFKLIIREEVPLNPHTFVFSLFQYFIRCILPIFIGVLLVLFISIQLIKYTTFYKPIITILALFTFIICIKYLLMFSREGEFTVEYGNIKFVRGLYHNFEQKRSQEEWYQIHYIREIKENLNSIIIYGDISKNNFRTHGVSTDLTKSKKITKLKVMKIYNNNRNLIKSLQIVSKNN